MSPIDLALARRQLEMVQGAVDALRQTLTETRSVTLTPGQSIQTALNDPAIDVILLAEGSYLGPLTCTRPVTLRPVAPIPLGRAMAPGPVVITSTAPATIATPGNGVTVAGVTVCNGVAANTLIDVTGDRTVLDRVRGLGGIGGQHRGIAANGTNTQILSCFVDECWLPGRDAQAIAGWKGTKVLQIVDCFLAGGAETVMFGGSDTATADQIPRDILIDRCTLTKRPTWYGLGAQIKNALELKNAIGVTVRDCQLEYAGAAEGQGGYVLMLTPRNQNGTNPWATVSDVLIERCTLRYGGAGISLMGSDDHYPSGPLARVTLRDLLITDLDPLDPGMFRSSMGQGRVIQINRGGQQITLERVTAIQGMKNMKAGVYCIGTPPTGLVLRNVALPACPYPLKIDNGGQGMAALRAYAPDAILETVTVDGKPVL